MVDDDDGTVQVDLTCTTEVSASVELEVDLLVSAFRGSLAEMIGCGALNVDLSRGVTEGIVNAIIQGRSDATPANWAYEGEGVYFTSGAQAEMETRFYLAEDFEFGRRGDVIEHNVFHVDSYLVGARVTTSAEELLQGRASLHFDEAGPLVELLGYGPDPQSPIQFNALDVASLGGKLSALDFESDVEVANVDAEESVVFRLKTQRMPAASLLVGGRMQYDLDSLRAVRGDLEIEIDAWDAGFFNSGDLDGSVIFNIDVEATTTCTFDLNFADAWTWPEWTGD